MLVSWLNSCGMPNVQIFNSQWIAPGTKQKERKVNYIIQTDLANLSKALIMLAVGKK